MPRRALELAFLEAAAMLLAACASLTQLAYFIIVFLGRRFWTEELPIHKLLAPLLAVSPLGDLTRLIHITDDVLEAASLLMN